VASDRGIDPQCHTAANRQSCEPTNDGPTVGEGLIGDLSDDDVIYLGVHRG
jgi:hypothetical protein